MTRGGVVLHLTEREASALAEAIRRQQEDHEETMGDGRRDATLSRIQRKLGEPLGSGN